MSINGGGDWVAGAGDGARFRYLAERALSALSSRVGAASGGTVATVHGRAFVDSDELPCRFDGAMLDADKESDRGVVPTCFVSSTELECIVPRAPGGRPGAVALAVSLNSGADFDGGDSSSVPGALVFEYVTSIAKSSLAPRAGPTSGTALRVFGEASRSRPNSRACSAAPRAATPPRRPSWARPTQHSAARTLGGGDDSAHAGA